MRLTVLAIAVVLSGISGNLQAAPRRLAVAANLPIVHKVKRGETADRIARANGLTLAQLAALNPRVNLKRLAVGCALRVRSRVRTVAPEPEDNPAVASLPAPQTVATVAPLPETPAISSVPLMHMEGVLPAADLTPPPEPGKDPDRSAVGAPSDPPMAGLRKVLPAGADDQPDEQVAIPAAAPSGEFEPADPDHLDLLWPVETRTISSPWGPRMRTRVVRIKTATRTRKVLRRFMGTHKGVDLSAPKGSPIFAALDGQVVVSGRQKAYGNYVAIDHGNGVVTLYAHCNRNLVSVGDIVRKGQKIAEVGRTGNATGPHVHFELRKNDVQVNPLPWLNDTEEVPADLMARNETAEPAQR
jgi:murein DD-endopeptidase MepM/ murein hydrolase activator NlpD